MAIIVETGAVVTGANSYVSLDYCDEYCELMGLTDWADGADEDKEAAILRAMAYIENQTFVGSKTNRDNPLRWPRYGVVDRDGFSLDSDSLPAGLLKATARAAYEELLSSGCLMPNMAREDYVVSETVGPISTTYAPRQYKPSFPMIAAYLVGLVEDGNTSVVRT